MKKMVIFLSCRQIFLKQVVFSIFCTPCPSYTELLRSKLHLLACFSWASSFKTLCCFRHSGISSLKFLSKIIKLEWALEYSRWLFLVGYTDVMNSCLHNLLIPGTMIECENMEILHIGDNNLRCTYLILKKRDLHPFKLYIESFYSSLENLDNNKNTTKI